MELILANCVEHMNQSEITDLDQVKDKLISVLSHRMRTPLNAIRWNTELLLEDHAKCFSTEQVSILKDIYENDLNLIDILNDLLFAIELWKGEVKANKEKLNLVFITNNVVGKFEEIALLKDLNIEFNTPDEAFHVFADSKHLNYVIYNILDNAIKYTPEGKKIILNIERKSENVVLSIEDQGIGILKKDHETIFDIFFRSGSAAEFHQDASGIGLFLAKRLLKLNEGEINFDSKINKGSIFTIEFPIIK